MFVPVYYTTTTDEGAFQISWFDEEGWGCRQFRKRVVLSRPSVTVNVLLTFFVILRNPAPPPKPAPVGTLENHSKLTPAH
jgi:hypothetical protein